MTTWSGYGGRRQRQSLMAREVGTSRSTAFRCYVSAVSALGGALFGWCVTRVVTVGVPVEWWMFAALTFISGRITLNVPGVEATFTVSEVFAFASVLLFGPEAGAVTLALDSLVLAWRRRMGVDMAVFNFANLTFAVWTSGSLFFAVSGVAPLLPGGQAAGRLSCRSRCSRSHTSSSTPG